MNEKIKGVSDTSWTWLDANAKMDAAGMMKYLEDHIFQSANRPQGAL